MKRLGLVLVSVALVLGLAQCKKNVEPVSEGVVPGVGDGEIVLRLVGDGSKLAVFPETGAVYYTAGDVIHVASGGTYCGTLTYHSDDDGGYFSGSLTNTPSPDAKMYFYFVGNKSLNEGSPTSSISVDISDQTENYPVIACGESVEGYGETTEYHATMKNKCALVKFDVESSVSPTTPTLIGGMNTVITFTFAGDGVGTPTTGTVGSIKLPGDSGERWAVLLKQDAVASSTKKSIVNSEIIDFTHGNIPAINDNDYLSTGIGVTVTSRELPEGAIPGLFTINDNGDQVLFSKGNLQYQASTTTWRFAENQYDYVGDATLGNVYEGGVKCDNSLISDSYTGWIDLFGWGTSGYNHGAVCYQPWSTSITASCYSGASLYAGDGKADWGYNAISNGGNTENSGWRTLTTDEWNYLLKTRTASTINGIPNARYSKATVDGVFGLMIFPDSFTWPDGVSVPKANAINAWGDYTAGSYSAEDWEQLEEQNVLFMPAAGLRQGTVVNDSGSVCGQWSSTSTYSVNVGSTYLQTQMGTVKYAGINVRLVLD